MSPFIFNHVLVSASIPIVCLFALSLLDGFSFFNRFWLHFTFTLQVAILKIPALGFRIVTSWESLFARGAATC